MDPFAGSGSTLIAATREGFAYIGIELNADYHEIATRRVNEETEQMRLFNNKPNDKMFNGTLFEED